MSIKEFDLMERSGVGNEGGDGFKEVRVAEKKSWGFFNKRGMKKNKNNKGSSVVVGDGKVMELAEIDPELVWYECVV